MDILFWEEPVFDDDWRAPARALRAGRRRRGPRAASRRTGLAPAEVEDQLRDMLDEVLAARGAPQVRWYYTPMMLPFTRHLAAECVVYDCMDELANFDFAPPELLELERELFAMADVVFTGGYSLYEAKRDVHPSVHPFPSSVDTEHFATRAARSSTNPPTRPRWPATRLGFFGVIDERMDLELLAAVADARPDWTIVMVGPVVKIDPATLPQRAQHRLSRRQDLCRAARLRRRAGTSR